MSGVPPPTPTGRGCAPCTRVFVRMTGAPDLPHSAPSNDTSPFVSLPPQSRPRKPPRRQRPYVQRTRYSADEMAELDRRARDAGFTVGAYCRACTLGDAGPRARRRVTVDREFIARNTAALNHIGSNLNQMARSLNEIALDQSTGRLAQVAEVVTPLDTTLDQLRAALAANRRALGYDSEG